MGGERGGKAPAEDDSDDPGLRTCFVVRGGISSLAEGVGASRAKELARLGMSGVDGAIGASSAAMDLAKGAVQGLVGSSGEAPPTDAVGEEASPAN